MAVTLFFLVFFGLDLCFYFSFKRFFKHLSKPRLKKILSIINITLISVCIFLYVFVFYYFITKHRLLYLNREYIFTFLLLFGVPKFLYVFVDFVSFCQNLAIKNKSEKIKKGRRSFLLKLGGIISSLVFGSFLYGIFKGKYNYKIENINVWFKNLPKELEGKKIVQLSDFHIGSFSDNYDEVQKIVDKVNSLNPDIIFFTGDLVNEIATEIDNKKFKILSKLKSQKKFAVLGNHDYGFYYNWNTKEEEKTNLINLKQKIKDLGFKLLLNENEKLTENSYVVGVENWGKRFYKFGDIKKATQGIDLDNNFCILLSHDPSHWENIIKDNYNIDITMSGHTHGLQMGVRFEELAWSPIKYFYKYWIGLYKEKNKYLYVNRGIGFIGFSGRVGMWPEITLFNFLKKT